MKEKYLFEKGNEHFILLNNLYSNIDTSSINNILDCGTGKTSLSSLLHNFKDAYIDAIVYYNDKRKIDSINSNIVSDRFKLIEKDICKDDITEKYDLVLAHLLLGEATTWGNSFKSLLERLLNINTKYMIIVDFKEDDSIDYDYLEQLCLNNNYEIISKIEFPKKEPQDFKTFIGKNYIGYCIKKN